MVKEGGLIYIVTVIKKVNDTYITQELYIACLGLKYLLNYLGNDISIIQVLTINLVNDKAILLV